jgi:hypothetical protein
LKKNGKKSAEKRSGNANKNQQVLLFIFGVKNLIYSNLNVVFIIK